MGRIRNCRVPWTLLGLILVGVMGSAWHAHAQSPAPAPPSEQAGPSPLHHNPIRGKGRGTPATPGGTATEPPAPATPSAADKPTDGAPTPGEAAFTRCLKVPSSKKLKWTVKQEAELSDLIGWISSITCRTFIVPQNIRSQKVMIIAPSEITASEAYRLFLSALNSIGLTVVPAGNALEVVETNRVKEGAPVYGPNEVAPGDDRYITRLVRVQNVPAAEMGAVLTKLRSKDGDVSWYDPTGTLILTDTASNVQRMIEIVGALDVAGSSEKIWLVKLHNTSATDMSQKLGEIFQVTQPAKGGSPSGPPAAGGPTRKMSAEKPGTVIESPGEIVVSKIIPDERSNSLIIVASEHAYGRIYALIRRLDASKEEADALDEGRVHVYELANANAEELAGTLGGLTGATVSTGTGTSGRRTTPPRGGGLQPPPPPPGGGGIPGAGAPLSGQVMLFEGDVRITADKPTNSLVILSSMKDFLTLKGVIKKLDVPRRQVFIEGAILEVSLDRSRQVGAWFHGGDIVSGGNTSTLVFGGLGASKTLFPSSPQGGLLPDLAQGLAAGALGPSLEGAQTILGSGISIPSFGVFLKLLATSNDVNVLSTPHILTTDNEEAEIKVGQNVPFQGAFLGGGLAGLPGGGAAGGAGAGALGGLGFAPSISVQRQDVALDLKITPHVNESGMVRLEVDQEISDIASENFNNLGPVTSKRTVKTVVVVKDQQPVVLGGLITDRVTNTVNKVPILGDIPILGYLFKNTTKKTQKTNLLVFLTPHVINDQSDLKRIFERKWQERREFLERYTAFTDQKDFEADMDYKHKRGLLEEINRTARQADDDQKMLDRIRQAQQQGGEGPVELPPGFRPTKTVPAPAGTGGAPSGGPSPEQPATPPPAMPAPPPQMPGPTPPPPAPAPNIGPTPRIRVE